MTSAASIEVKISLDLATLFKAQKLKAVTLLNKAPLMNTLKLILQLFEFVSCLDFQAVSEEDKKIENMSAFANYRSMRKCEMKEIKSKVPFVEFRILISALNPI